MSLLLQPLVFVYLLLNTTNLVLGFMFTIKIVTGVTFATILAAVAPMMQQQSAGGAAMGMRAEALQ